MLNSETPIHVFKKKSYMLDTRVLQELVEVEGGKSRSESCIRECFSSGFWKKFFGLRYVYKRRTTKENMTGQNTKPRIWRTRKTKQGRTGKQFKIFIRKTIAKKTKKNKPNLRCCVFVMHTCRVCVLCSKNGLIKGVESSRTFRGLVHLRRPQPYNLFLVETLLSVCNSNFTLQIWYCVGNSKSCGYSNRRQEISCGLLQEQLEQLRYHNQFKNSNFSLSKF